MFLYNPTVAIFHSSCGSQPAQSYFPLRCGFWIPQIQGYMARYHRMAHFPLRCDHGGAEATLCLQNLSVCEARDSVQYSFHSQFSRTKEEPDPKAGFLKQQIFKDTWSLNLDFTPNLVSSVCTYDKSDLRYMIRNHTITSNCPVQASSFCRIQPLQIWHFSGRAGL